MGGDPCHFDAVKAQVMDVPTHGDLSLSMAALACTHTFVCTGVHMPGMDVSSGLARLLVQCAKEYSCSWPCGPLWVTNDGRSNNPEQGKQH